MRFFHNFLFISVIAFLSFHFSALPALDCTNNDKLKILIGSPIRRTPKILKEFLFSLAHLRQESCTFDYFFIDDNDNHESSELLQQFAQSVPTECTLYKAPPTASAYICNENTHHWNDSLIWRVADFKNMIITKAITDNYDYLFFIDSDIVLNPRTIEHLITTNKEIISEIFWTRWNPNDEELPQVWISDFYTLNDEFLRRLRNPGVYEVGGLGACTLISKKALQAGVNFKQIRNLTFWGEDRHFCIRAGALGVPLHVDTHFPAYHIFRESALNGLDAFKKNNDLPA